MLSGIYIAARRRHDPMMLIRPARDRDVEARVGATQGLVVEETQRRGGRVAGAGGALLVLMETEQVGLDGAIRYPVRRCTVVTR